jgi:lipopolysaccharide biosynthesis glycosyltransferase
MAHVVIAADGPHLEHSIVPLRSALAHAGTTPMVVHLLHGDDLTHELAGRLAGAAQAAGGELALHRVGRDQLTGLPQYRQMTPANWYRYLVPVLLGDVDAALYLDVDTVVADDLAPLFATELGDHYLAAVDDVLPDWAEGRSLPRGIALPPGQRYFNAGVMLLNLAALREDEILPQLIAHARFNENRSWLPNQDTLNVVLGARRLVLGPRWNVTTHMLNNPESSGRAFGDHALSEAVAKPGIRHFTGDVKPWNPGFEAPGLELYAAYA